MLVSAKQQAMILPLKRPGEDPTADAASGLQSAALQALRDNVQAQASQGDAQVRESVIQQATQQVNATTAISDNVDEAFAKTRVQLQTVASQDATARATDSSALKDFKDYMSKTPEERLREAVLAEMGISEEEYEAMPPEKQLAVGQEIAQRMQDKSAMAQVEKAQEHRDTGDKDPAAAMLLTSL
ncbi:hypothetical protein LOY64_07420 [Pseudomonas corrugata]|jgi:hypothetical protein|uniref:Uncharacterized protein n=1 Tax=Pseudomonas corrugata TaxID=47879 RepID=A0A8B6UUU1_9PSED|nr:hypothetical protein [Pseudomonas corrugata]AOE64345.1 hypothetical protein AXG94_22135 [Pseudomonas corrugata]MDU9036146.1 hypothetical protein [Pseudomonas corrugata]MDU9038450.1 hypothetical protein [Pseudomonas corrugata]QTH15668.1 hypothetical protein C4C32_07150 [Pseudomonas corrugata]UZD96827.1 hypothetical protein LOY64_07420 [Pseudomonas corrugata]